MHCKVLQLELSKPEPHEFGYLYCKDSVRYISFKEVSRPLSWCLGKNHIRTGIPWIVSKVINNLVTDVNIHLNAPGYVSTGQLDWDDAAIPAVGLMEAIGLPKTINFNSFSSLNATDLNKTFSRKLLVLGKKLTSEDLKRELLEYVKIDNAVQFSALMDHLTMCRKGNNAHKEKVIVVKAITTKNFKSATEYEEFLSDHFKAAASKKSCVTVKDLIEASVDEIVSFISSPKGDPSKRFAFVDIRTLLASCSTTAEDVDSVEDIYLGKIEKDANIPSNFLIGVVKNRLQTFCLLRNNKGLGSKAEAIIGVDYNIGGAKVQISKLAVPDVFAGKNMLQETKKVLHLDETKTEGVIRNIPSESLDSAVSAMQSFIRSNLALGNGEFTIVPIPTPLKVSDFLTQHMERVPISLGKQKVFGIGTACNFLSYDHNALSNLDTAICESIWKQTGDSKARKFSLSNKANIRLEDKREEISKKLGFLYTALEKFLRFQLKAHIGFSKIPRSHIIVSSNRVNWTNIPKDTSLINTANTFLTVKAFTNLKSFDKMEEAFKEGGYKKLASAAKIPEYKMILTADNTNAAELFDNKKTDVENLDLEMAFRVDGEISIINMSVLKNNSVSALLFQVLLINCIENEAMLNVDGVANKLITNENIIESSLEDCQFTQLELMQSIYA